MEGAVPGLGRRGIGGSPTKTTTRLVEGVKRIQCKKSASIAWHGRFALAVGIGGITAMLSSFAAESDADFLIADQLMDVIGIAVWVALPPALIDACVR